MPQLDGLRAVAVFAVILHHSLPPKFVKPLEFGVGGVQLFFVLSGFLITGILLRARKDAAELQHNRGQIIVAFYARRCLRIFPLYYAVLGLAILIGIPDAIEPAAWHFAYATNIYCFLTREWVGPLSHFWSLAVEEQFYLFWPAIVLFVPRRLLGPFFLTVIAAAPVFRVVVLRLTRNHFVDLLTPSCLDSLGLGSFLAFLWQSREPIHVRILCRWCLISGLVLLIGLKGLWAFGYLRPTIQIGMMSTTLALIFVWIVNGAAHGFSGPVGAILSSRPMLYLGTISYGLYVWQQFAAYPTSNLRSVLSSSSYYPDEFGASRVLFVAVFALISASLSWFLLERPINTLKRLFPYLRREANHETVLRVCDRKTPVPTSAN
jgi:peptidoglycan/LPS O-acetylase OafA/YrhL